MKNNNFNGITVQHTKGLGKGVVQSFDAEKGYVYIKFDDDNKIFKINTFLDYFEIPDKKEKQVILDYFNEKRLEEEKAQRIEAERIAIIKEQRAKEREKQKNFQDARKCETPKTFESYYPASHPKHNTDYVTNILLDAKNGLYQDAMNEFYPLVKEWLISQGLTDLDIVVSVIPGHKKCTENNSFTSALAKELIKEFGFIDGINLVLRKTTVDKKSTAKSEGKERPRFSADIESLMINPEDNIDGKTILLIDDIKTTGSVLCAAGVLLYRKGAERVVPIAMGETTYDD